jgi:hypothetical protein
MPRQSQESGKSAANVTITVETRGDLERYIHDYLAY